MQVSRQGFANGKQRKRHGACCVEAARRQRDRRAGPAVSDEAGVAEAVEASSLAAVAAAAAAAVAAVAAVASVAATGATRSTQTMR